MAFKKDLNTFESLNTQVLGVSSDSIETLKAFADENGIAFPLISDAGGKLKSLYSNKRINYLIDRSGVVQMIQNGIPKNDFFIQKIRALEK
ncbi:MAG: redoxin domain-containing protein [bacterium]|nr:MAG: redoxin domain-containing protein [bacterium]